jgi:hypothetical protein
MHNAHIPSPAQLFVALAFTVFNNLKSIKKWLIRVRYSENGTFYIWLTIFCLCAILAFFIFDEYELFKSKRVAKKNSNFFLCFIFICQYFLVL